MKRLIWAWTVLILVPPFALGATPLPAGSAPTPESLQNARERALAKEKEPEALTQAVDDIFYGAFWSCPKPTPEGLVVIEVTRSGRIDNVWIQPENEVTLCARNKMVGKTLKYQPKASVLVSRDLRDNEIPQTELAEKRARLLAGEGSDHDEPMNFVYAGDPLAIPAIISVLERNPAFPDGSMICTRGHALDALERLTGQPLAKTEDWKLWWKTNQARYLNGEIAAPAGPTQEAFKKARQYIASHPAPADSLK